MRGCGAAGSRSGAISNGAAVFGLSLKILVFSGYMPQDAGKDIEAFGIDFLEKPAPVDRLLKHIRTLLERKA